MITRTKLNNNGKLRIFVVKIVVNTLVIKQDISHRASHTAHHTASQTASHAASQLLPRFDVGTLPGVK